MHLIAIFLIAQLTNIITGILYFDAIYLQIIIADYFKASVPRYLQMAGR